MVSGLLLRDAREVEIRRFDADDAEAVRACAAVYNAAREADSPWVHPATEIQLAGNFRYGWDLEPRVPFLGTHDGTVVGVASYAVSEHDNLHLAWLDVVVHPDHRRRGYGTALLEAMIDEARGLGRTSVGFGGWEGDQVRGFAARHGLEQKAIEVNRRQHLTEVDWAEIERLRDEACARAGDYELERRTGPTPDDELPALAEMTAAINDAPTDDLDIEDEVFSPDRIRAYEQAQLVRRHAFYRLFARHRATGELAGQTVVAIEGDRPHLADQHDTSVVRAHRGHRLGLLLKAEMMLWLRETQPQVTLLDTWNAESNDFMIGVNELLGYRIVGRELVFQKTL